MRDVQGEMMCGVMMCGVMWEMMWGMGCAGCVGWDVRGVMCRV